MQDTICKIHTIIYEASFIFVHVKAMLLCSETHLGVICVQRKCVASKGHHTFANVRKENAKIKCTGMCNKMLFPESKQQSQELEPLMTCRNVIEFCLRSPGYCFNCYSLDEVEASFLAQRLIQLYSKNTLTSLACLYLSTWEGD